MDINISPLSQVTCGQLVYKTEHLLLEQAETMMQIKEAAKIISSSKNKQIGMTYGLGNL